MCTKTEDTQTDTQTAAALDIKERLCKLQMFMYTQRHRQLTFTFLLPRTTQGIKLLTVNSRIKIDLINRSVVAAAAVCLLLQKLI